MVERAHLTIGEVLSLLREEFPDVSISKIRFLESQGLVDPERTPSGYRKFYEQDVERLRWILQQQREHFLPLKVIRGRLIDPSDADADDVTMPMSTLPGAGAPPSPPALVGPRLAVHETVPATTPAARPLQAPAGSRPLPAPPTPVAPAPAPATTAPATTAPAAPVVPAPVVPAAPVVPPVTTAPTSAAPVVAAEPVVPATAEPAAPAEPAAAGEPQAATPPRTQSPPRTQAPPSLPARSRAPGGAASSGVAPPVTTRPAPSPEAGQPDVYTAAELADAAGCEAQLVRDLQQYGLLVANASVGGVAYFDHDALDIARTGARFAAVGVEPRHLRSWRNAADREASLFEQLVMPLLRQRNPQARRQAAELLQELSTLGGELRSELMKDALRGIR